MKLTEYLKRHRPKKHFRFKPHAYFNEAGDQIEVYWSNKPCYTKEVRAGRFNVMKIHYDMESNEPVGVTVYVESIKAGNGKSRVKVQVSR